MKDLVSKINQALNEAQSFTDLEKSNPRTIRDYCYRDGCPTDWKRKDITQKDIGKERIPYRCDSCHDTAYYSLKRGKTNAR